MLFAVVGFIMLMAMTAFIVFVFSQALKRRAYDAKRGQQMQQVARRLGFTFKPQASLAELPFFASFELFEGARVGFENLMTGTSRNHTVVVFDLVYRNVGGTADMGSTTSRQTMAAVVSNWLSLPTFYLRPEGAIETVLNALDRVDIDFAERPLFSKQFLLYGRDEAAIRRLFTPPRLDLLQNYPRLCAAGQGNCLYFYNSRTVAQPDQIEQYARFVDELHDIFRQ